VPKYTVYSGKFICKECKKEVLTMRMYPETGEGTWMCSDKHLTKVQIAQTRYKKKKDYERKERE
jgi:hypothetical protein